MWGGVACFSDDDTEQNPKHSRKVRKQAPLSMSPQSRHTIGGGSKALVPVRLLDARISNRFLLIEKHEHGARGSSVEAYRKAVPSCEQRRPYRRQTHEHEHIDDGEQLRADLLDNMACCLCTRSQTNKARIMVVRPSDCHEEHHPTHGSDMVVPDCGVLLTSTAEVGDGRRHQGCEYRATLNKQISSRKWDDADIDLACMLEEPTCLQWRLLTH